MNTDISFAEIRDLVTMLIDYKYCAADEGGNMDDWRLKLIRRTEKTLRRVSQSWIDPRELERPD